MAHTNVLLREDIDSLGARGEIVRVRAGYARNYLLPRKLAVEATASNVKQINLPKLPQTWSELPMAEGLNSADSSMILVSHGLQVVGRGSARLDLAAPIEYPVAALLQAQGGVGAIGAAALLSLLLGSAVGCDSTVVEPVLVLGVSVLVTAGTWGSVGWI